MSGRPHPIARHLRQRVGGSTWLLASVMLLPLIDGIFPAMVLSGALSGWPGVVQVGLLIFGGSATFAVVVGEMDGSRRSLVRTVSAVGVPLVVLAAVEAAYAPVFAELLDLELFARFAAIVILAVAAKTASARIGELLPGPGIIVVFGVVASVQPGAIPAVTPDLELALRAAVAGFVGWGFALVAAVFAPTLRRVVHLDRFRFGSAVALGLLPLSILGLPFGNAPLAVLGLSALFAYEPDGPTTNRATPTHSDQPQGPHPSDKPQGPHPRRSVADD